MKIVFALIIGLGLISLPLIKPIINTEIRKEETIIERIITKPTIIYKTIYKTRYPELYEYLDSLPIDKEVKDLLNDEVENGRFSKSGGNTFYGTQWENKGYFLTLIGGKQWKLTITPRD